MTAIQSESGEYRLTYDFNDALIFQKILTADLRLADEGEFQKVFSTLKQHKKYEPLEDGQLLSNFNMYW